MYEVTSYYDPFLGRRINWSRWQPEPAPAIRIYLDKYMAYRPLQQRARDGTVIRHKTNRIANTHRIEER